MLDTAKEILLNKKIRRFLLSSLIILMIWVLFSIFFPVLLHKGHFWAIYPQAHFSAGILGIFGYSTHVLHYVNNCMSLLDINNAAVVCIGTGCSGMELFLIFGVFILLFRGKSKDYIWYIPLGIILIALLNIIRIIALSLIVYYAPEYLDFNHKYTFTLIVYGFLIWLWLHWMKNYYVEK